MRHNGPHPCRRQALEALSKGTMSNLPSVSNLAPLHTPWPGPITAKGRPELRLDITDPDPADGPVRYLQRLLRDRGYDYVLVNGQFDLLTLAAVKDFQLRQLSVFPSSTTEANAAIDQTVVDDAVWEALLTPSVQSFTAQLGQPVLAPCPLGTNQHFPPDLVIPGRSRSVPAGELLTPQAIAAYQYTHFSPQSPTWQAYAFRDDQGQLPQLRLGDADPQGSIDGPIRQLQAFLQDHGYYKGEVNGQFDQELHDVVVAYQNSHPSLLSDGVINAADWGQLFHEDRQDVTTSPTTSPTASMTTRAAVQPLAPIDATIASTIVNLSEVPTIAPLSVSVAPASDRPTTATTTTPNHHPWLRLHATDDDLPNGPIRQLQRLLFVIGLGVPLTGIFDVTTEQAVRQFQSQFPELTDPPGEVGPDTWAKLEQEAAKPLDPFALLAKAQPATDAAALVSDPSLAWDESWLASPSASPSETPIATSPIKIVDLATPPPPDQVDLGPIDLNPVDLSPVTGAVPPATAPAALPLLQKGQTDTAAQGPIAHLQTLLNEYGYVLTVDGQFNEATFQAVSNFQFSHDLPPTGVVDRATWEVLMGQDTTPPAGAEVTLPTWDALMGDVLMGPAVNPGHGPPAATGLLAAVPPLDVSLPPELTALSPADRDSGTEPSPPLAAGEALRPDPLIPSATPPPPTLALVDLYAQGDTPLTTSQQQALQWLSQQLPTATLTEFQQRWHIQGSGT